MSTVVPYTTAFCAGCVISSVAGLLTETVTAVEVVVLPAASLARAAIVRVPFGTAVLSHVVEYGATVSSNPTGAPFTRNCTPATPMLSLACAESATCPVTVVESDGDVIVRVGGVTAGAGFDSGVFISVWICAWLNAPL